MTDYNDGKPSISELKMHFAYDPVTGVITTITKRRNLAVGQVVGTADRQGYLVTSLFKKPLKLHRIAWAIFHGEWPNLGLDHVNRIKSDNRISNLRLATNSQNHQNKPISSTNTSGHMGVSFHKKSQKWVANIKIDGKAKYLGLFDEKESAAQAYDDARKLLHPFSEVEI